MAHRLVTCLLVLSSLALPGCCRRTSHRRSQSQEYARTFGCRTGPGENAREWACDAVRGGDGRVSQSDLWWRRVRRGECD